TAVGKPAADHLQPGQHPAAGTWLRTDPGDITGAITDQRHRLSPEGGDSQLSETIVIRVEDLSVQIAGTQMLALMGTAVYASGQPRLRESVMGIDFCSPKPGNPLPYGVQNIVSA